MNGNKKCPLTLGNGNPYASQICIKSQCEWWNSIHNNCAMNVLVLLAEKSEKELCTISKLSEV